MIVCGWKYTLNSDCLTEVLMGRGMDIRTKGKMKRLNKKNTV